MPRNSSGSYYSPGVGRDTTNREEKTSNEGTAADAQFHFTSSLNVVRSGKGALANGGIDFNIGIQDLPDEWGDRVMKDTKGKVAFITGGASGIGLGMAKAFVSAGMKAVLADIRDDHLDAARAHFAEAGGEVHCLKLDVTDRDGFARAADEAEDVFGNVHVLCNNAGIGVAGPIQLATYDDWDWVMDVNLGGVINGVVTFVNRMIEHGEGGHIVNTASKSGLFSSGQAGLYITAKFGVVGLSEALRTDLQGTNVSVSAFCPGPVATNIGDSPKTRPANRAETGYAETDKRRQNLGAEIIWMDAVEVGERVLNGIRNDEIYILTHPEFRDGVIARHEAIMRAFPDEPINRERADSIRFLLSNPIYDAK